MKPMRWIAAAIATGAICVMPAQAEEPPPVDITVDVIKPPPGERPDIRGWANRFRPPRPKLPPEARERIRACVDDGSCDADADGRPDREYMEENFSQYLPDRDENGVPDREQLRGCVEDGTCDADADGRPDSEYLVTTFGVELPDRDENGVPDRDQIHACVLDGSCDSDGDGRPDREYLQQTFGPGPFRPGSHGGGQGRNPDRDENGVPDREQIRVCVEDGSCDADGDGRPDTKYLQETLGIEPRDRDGDGVPDRDQLRACVADGSCDSDKDGRPDREYIRQHFGAGGHRGGPGGPGNRPPLPPEVREQLRQCLQDGSCDSDKDGRPDREYIREHFPNLPDPRQRPGMHDRRPTPPPPPPQRPGDDRRMPHRPEDRGR